MMTCQEMEQLISAYVLDAVDETERQEIETHLPQCANCRRLVQEYQPVADLMPYAADQVEPRAELKYRVLAAMQPRAPLQTAPNLGVRLADVVASLWRTPAFSAVALLMVVALTLWNVNYQNQIASEVARQNELLTMVAYSDGQPRHLQGTEVAARAIGRLYSGYEESAFVVATYDLPVLPPNQVYQLWLIDASGTRTSGGTFTVDNHGRGWLLGHAPKPLDEYRSVGVTVEPWGGSPGPTGAKILGGNL